MHNKCGNLLVCARVQVRGFQGQDAAILSPESIPRAEKGLTGKAKSEGNGQ